MITTERKENLKPLIKDIQELFIGFTRDDANYIFEEAIVGLYQLQSRSPYEEGKYKIVLRETGEEVNFDWKETSLLL